MARISEFEQRNEDTLEIAISQAEYDRLGDPSDPLELRITILSDNGSEQGSYLLSTDPVDWGFDAVTQEYYLLDAQSNAFGNHRTNWDGLVLSSTNSSGLDTVEQALMVAPWNENPNTDGALATSVISATHIPVGTTLTLIDQSNATGSGSGATLRFDAPNIDTPIVSTEDDLGSTGTAPPVCYVSGTKIACADGVTPVENLRVGDLLRTASGKLVTIRWIGRSDITPEEMLSDPRLRPVRIKAGCLGGKLPESDLLVSRQHRIVFDAPQVQQVARVPVALIAAHRMTPIKGISLVCPKRTISYFHILLDQHELLIANGLESESLLLGEQALRMLSDHSLLEIESLLAAGLSGDPALPIPQGGVQRKIIAAFVMGQHYQGRAA